MRLDADRLCSRFPDDRSIRLVLAEELAHNLCHVRGKASHTAPWPSNEALFKKRHQEMEDDAQTVLREWGYTAEEYQEQFERLEKLGLCRRSPTS
jgi:transcriptional regulator of met regulon